LQNANHRSRHFEGLASGHPLKNGCSRHCCVYTKTETASTGNLARSVGRALPITNPRSRYAAFAKEGIVELSPWRLPQAFGQLGFAARYLAPLAMDAIVFGEADPPSKVTH
jgi:hypothetical protein